MGTPVDPTPAVVRDALACAADAPGYPLTAGTAQLRAAAAGWLLRRLGVSVDPATVLPTLGSKELVAALPSQLGISGAVSFPALAYPTYDIGARLAGCDPLPAQSLTALGPRRVGLAWVNSPANPTGQVLGVDHLRKVVDWARQRGAVVASDECYVGFGWDAEPVSILHPDVCGDDHSGLLAVHSLSKRSNLAGYRAGFVTGDPVLVAHLLEVRRHAGLMVPTPVQAAMVAALDDDGHAEEQKERYRQRRGVLRAALEYAAFTIEHSEGGLYLWATAGEPCWETVGALAELGILVAPGEFYGGAGGQYVRVALTGTDERVAAAAARLRAG